MYYIVSEWHVISDAKLNSINEGLKIAITDANFIGNDSNTKN